MIDRGNELEEIDNIHKTDLERREELAEESGGGEGFVGWDVAAGGHDDVGLDALIVAGPVPDSDTLGAVLDGIFHVEELQVVLLVGDNNVDVVSATEAVVGYGKETVSIGWEVDSDDFGRFVGHDIEETGILVSEAVVVLTPDSSSEKDIE